MPPNQFWYCAAMNFMIVSCLLCSTYLLMAMTFERFYSIIRPHKAASFNTVGRAKITIVCTYALCLSYSLPFLFIGSHNGRLCIPNRFASDNVWGELYYWLTEILTFIFPFISLLTINSVIINTLRKRSKQDMLVSVRENNNSCQSVKKKNTEKQIFTMLLLVTFVFLAFNTPTHLLVFFPQFLEWYYFSVFCRSTSFLSNWRKSHFTNHGVNFFMSCLVTDSEQI